MAAMVLRDDVRYSDGKVRSFTDRGGNFVEYGSARMRFKTDNPKGGGTAEFNFQRRGGAWILTTFSTVF